MSNTLKIAAASGVLAAGLVFFALPSGASVPTAKAFTATASMEAGRSSVEIACAKSTWPYVPQDCAAAAATRAVRMIAIERTTAR